MKLSLDFYRRDNVLLVAEELLGKIIVTRWDGIVTSGRIVEVEAYNGIVDRASHAYGGRRTKRNEIMYSEGGVAYIYFIYGIHHLFNVVTFKKDTPHAVLIRSLEPLKGVDEMLRRTGKKVADHTLTRGPGNMSKALGIHTSQTGHSLRSKELYLEDDGFRFSQKQIGKSPRIGVDYAGEDAKLPYRFFIKENKYVSGRKTSE